MLKDWTPEAIKAYERAIKLAPKQRKKIEMKRKYEFNKLFNRLHRDCFSNKNNNKEIKNEVRKRKKSSIP